MTGLAPDTYEEAVEAWFEHCEIEDIVPQEPSFADSSMDDLGVVVLRNQDGFLARYSPKMKRILTNL